MKSRSYEYTDVKAVVGISFSYQNNYIMTRKDVGSMTINTSYENVFTCKLTKTAFFKELSKALKAFKLISFISSENFCVKEIPHTYKHFLYMIF